MKTNKIVIMLAVLVMAAAGWAQPVLPVTVNLAKGDTTYQAVLLTPGAGVETELTTLNESYIAFDPVATFEALGFRLYAPETMFKYFEIGVLIAAPSTNVTPHLGLMLRIGHYAAAGVTWSADTRFFYLDGTELATTIAGWIGKGVKYGVKKI